MGNSGEERRPRTRSETSSFYSCAFCTTSNPKPFKICETCGSNQPTPSDEEE